MDWSFPPDLQIQYERVLAQTRRLQAELGITPMTLEERAAAYDKRRMEEQRKQQELAELQQRLIKNTPLPKWKV